MKILVQRVSQASVSIDGALVAQIGAGLLALVGVAPGDTETQASGLLRRLLKLRVFADAQGRMNLSLADTGGGLLLVPNFTLMADMQRGARPSFTTAADPALAKPLFDKLCSLAADDHETVACGEFGADMQVQLTNDGPVTLMLEL